MEYLYIDVWYNYRYIHEKKHQFALGLWHTPATSTQNVVKRFYWQFSSPLRENFWAASCQTFVKMLPFRKQYSLLKYSKGYKAIHRRDMGYNPLTDHLPNQSSELEFHSEGLFPQQQTTNNNNAESRIFLVINLKKKWKKHVEGPKSIKHFLESISWVVPLPVTVANGGL